MVKTNRNLSPMKNQKGISTLTLTIYICFIATLFAFTYAITPGTFGGKQVSDHYLKSCAGQLDEALSVYYRYHSKTYPSSLVVLKTLGNIPTKFPVSSFTYSVNAGSTLYHLTVSLATGMVYVSPNSKM